MNEPYNLEVSTRHLEYEDVTHLDKRLCAAFAMHGTRQPATITICSVDGNPYAAVDLYERIRIHNQRGHSVTVRLAGRNTWVGLLIMQSADTRIVRPGALIQLSNMSKSELSRRRQETCSSLWQRLQRQTCTILAERSTLSEQQIRSNVSQPAGWLLRPAIMVQLGIADRIA